MADGPFKSEGVDVLYGRRCVAMGLIKKSQAEWMAKELNEIISSDFQRQQPAEFIPPVHVPIREGKWHKKHRKIVERNVELGKERDAALAEVKRMQAELAAQPQPGDWCIFGDDGNFPQRLCSIGLGGFPYKAVGSHCTWERCRKATYTELEAAGITQ